MIRWEVGIRRDPCAGDGCVLRAPVASWVGSGQERFELVERQHVQGYGSCAVHAGSADCELLSCDALAVMAARRLDFAAVLLLRRTEQRAKLSAAVAAASSVAVADSAVAVVAPATAAATIVPVAHLVIFLAELDCLEPLQH